MNKPRMQTFHHVCPRNCPSSCTMWSYVDNGHVKHITGDSTHPYTNGKLCQKGFSYIEQNYHDDRLKYPYYQKVKGSGKFKPISWKKAYELITNELIKIHKDFATFYPFALYKGTGNIGVHHDVTEKFFASLNGTSRIFETTSSINRPNPSNHLWQKDISRPATIVNASVIIIWGANPAVSDIHLIPLIIKAKINGTKVVVIDALLTKTAELADLFVQLRPNTDQTLAYIIMQALIKNNQHDAAFIEQYTSGFNHIHEVLKSMNTEEAIKQCDIPIEALNQLLSLLKDANVVSYILGAGIQKHRHSKETFQAIEALAVIRGDVDKRGGGLFYRHHHKTISTDDLNSHHRSIYLDELSYYSSTKNDFPIEMLWVSCGNPLIQEIDPEAFKTFMLDTPFVVTVDRFMTPTARMSNLILPTTTHFEETDIVVNDWHHQMALNEAAVLPYAESKSEWTIMTELACHLKEQTPLAPDFSIYHSEEAYLDAQLNNDAFVNYDIQNLNELKKVNKTPYVESQHADSNKELYHFDKSSDLIDENTFKPTISQSNDYPFWLITPNHPYALNSQFHYLNLSDETEAFIGINPKIAEKRHIFDGEVVRVFNAQASIQIKALYSYRVPNDIVMIYQGWYPDSQVTINRLISNWQEARGDNPSCPNDFVFYDTFVNIEKI